MMPSRTFVQKACTWTITAATALIATACSLGAPDHGVVRIAIPESMKSSSSSKIDLDALALVGGMKPGRIFLSNKNAMSSGSSSSEPPMPANFGDFTCFGLNVTGPGIVSTIPGAQDAKCDHGSFGQFGGLALVKDGVIEMSVPFGASRHIQLFGVKSLVGCPNLEDLFRQEAAGKDGTKGLGEPLLLGETEVDLFNDQDVTIQASYDAAHPVKIFDGCVGGGDGYPAGSQPVALTAAYAGSLTYPSPSPSPSASPSPSPSPSASPIGDPTVFRIQPSLAAGAPELNGSHQLSAIELEKISTAEDYHDTPPPISSDNSAIFILTTATAGPSPHGVIQLQWDVTGMDLSTLPYVAIDVSAAGGKTSPALAADGTIQQCANASPSPSPSPGMGGGMNDPNGAFPGVFNTVTSQFVAGRKSYSYQYPDWSSLYARTSDVVMTKGGRKVIVVNVESNYMTYQSDTCASTVAIAHAKLVLMPSPKAISISPENPLVPAYNSQWIEVDGGIPPYTAAVISGTGSVAHEAGLSGSLNRFTYQAGETQGPVIVRVTDATGMTSDLSLTVGPPAIATRFDTMAPAMPGASPSPSPSPVAGACAPFHIFLKDDYGMPAVASMEFTVSLSGTPTPAGEMHLVSDCSDSAVTSFPVAAGAFSATYYYRQASSGGPTGLNLVANNAMPSVSWYPYFSSPMMAVTSGGGQTVGSGSTSAAIVVRVTDMYGSTPQPGLPVQWSITGPCTIVTPVSPYQSTTDANGQVSATVSRTTAGACSLTAASGGGSVVDTIN